MAIASLNSSLKPTQTLTIKDFSLNYWSKNMGELDLLIVGAIAGMIAIANPSLNPIKIDTSIKQPRSIASSQLQPTHRSERPTRQAPISRGSNMEAQLNNELASLPPALRNVTRNVALRQGCSPYDGCRTMASTAGGTGLIEVWNGGQSYIPSLGHEAAHLLAYQKYGNYTPPGYQEVWESEGGVSDYGSTSPTEDFAEAVQQYVDGRLQSERKREFVQKALNE
jgi:hypothetical protein